jgi:cellulase/cellobiase CelA1
VTNISGEALTWEITLDVPGTINSMWNAEQFPTGNGDEITFSGVSWNASISPGQTADFGFCAQI